MNIEFKLAKNKYWTHKFFSSVSCLLSLMALTAGCRTIYPQSRSMDSRTNSSAYFIDRSIWKLLVTTKDANGSCKISERSSHTTYSGVVVAKDAQKISSEFYFISGSSSSLSQFDGSKYCGLLRQFSTSAQNDHEIDIVSNFVSLKDDVSVFALNLKLAESLSWKGDSINGNSTGIEANGTIVLNNNLEFSRQLQGQVSSLNSTRVALGQRKVHEISWNVNSDLKSMSVGQSIFTQNQFLGILGSSIVGLQEGMPAKKCLMGAMSSCSALSQNFVLIPGSLIVKTLQSMSKDSLVVGQPRLRVQSHLPTEILVGGARIWETSCSEQEGRCSLEFERSFIGNETTDSSQSAWAIQFQGDLQKFFKEKQSGEVKIAFCQDGERSITNILGIATAVIDQCRIKLDALSESKVSRRTPDEWTLLAQSYKEEQESLKSDIAMVWQKMSVSRRGDVYQSLSLQGRKVLFEAVEQKSSHRSTADQMYGCFEQDARALASEWVQLSQTEKVGGWITKNITERIFMFNGVGESSESNIMDQLDKRFPRFANDIVREYLEPDSFRGEIAKVLTAPWKRQAVVVAGNGVTKGVVNFSGPDRENRWLKIDVPVSCSAAKWKFQVGTLAESTIESARALDLGHYLVEQSKDVLTYYFRVTSGKLREDEKDLFAVAQVYYQRSPGQGPCQVVLSTSDVEIFIQNFEVGKILRASDLELNPHQTLLTCQACELREEKITQELFDLIDRGLIVDLNIWASMLRAY